MNGIWVHWKSGDNEVVSICDEIRMKDDRETDMMSIEFVNHGLIEHELCDSSAYVNDVWNAITYAIYQNKKYVYVSEGGVQASTKHKANLYGAELTGAE